MRAGASESARRKVLFALIIATLMVPGQILLVPVYLILNRLGWLDTPLALIVPAGAGAFGVFLLHQFFKAIPQRARRGGAARRLQPVRIYWHIMLPLSSRRWRRWRSSPSSDRGTTSSARWCFFDSVEKFTLPVGVALFQSSATPASTA